MQSSWHNLTNKRRLAVMLLGVLVLACVAFIFSNSLDTREQSLGKSGMVERLLTPIILALPFPALHTPDIITLLTRKLAHFGEFFLLGALAMGLAVALRPMVHINLWQVLLACVLVAVCDELLQFITDRAPRLTDVLIDAAGSFSGLLLVQLFFGRGREAGHA